MFPNQQRKGTFFVHGPYACCPKCGEERLGVLSIFDHHYTRRCKHCTHDVDLLLPPLNKKVIYLDQFVISNMMKELDPASPSLAKGVNNGFYRVLFERLDRLFKLQLIICPNSPVQHDESLVDRRFEKLRLVFRHLSHGLSFEPPEIIFHAELLDAFRRWLGGPPTASLDREFALNGKFNVWNDRLRIDLNYTLPGLAASLRESGEIRTKHMHGVCERWRLAQSFSFQDVVVGESRAIVEGPWREWQRYGARIALAQQVPHSSESALNDLTAALPMAASSLVSHMLTELKELPVEDRFERMRQFFASAEAQSVSYVKISALFWGSLARDVRAGRNPKNYPSGSLYNDVDIVAAYSKFCDAMFVDKQVSHLASQAELKRELAGHCRLFSFRKGEAEQFLEYLEQIENGATPEHLAKVAEVYGTDWPTPYVDLLSNADCNAGKDAPRCGSQQSIGR
jgi:hypothetical protein